MQTFRTLAVVALLTFGIALPASAQTIVDIASGDPQFSSLVNAVVAQDLASTLASEGPFTVFAPTNDAFAKLPSYIGDILAKQPQLLTDILLYHVVADELFAADVLAETKIKTVGGESLRVGTRGGDAYVDNSKIVATDVEASNGVVHVIDTVLIPASVYQAVITDLRSQIQKKNAGVMGEVRKDQAQAGKAGNTKACY